MLDLQQILLQSLHRVIDITMENGECLYGIWQFMIEASLEAILTLSKRNSNGKFIISNLLILLKYIDIFILKRTRF